MAERRRHTIITRVRGVSETGVSIDAFGHMVSFPCSDQVKAGAALLLFRDCTATLEERGRLIPWELIEIAAVSS